MGNVVRILERAISMLVVVDTKWELCGDTGMMLFFFYSFFFGWLSSVSFFFSITSVLSHATPLL